jgi:hypothetical protein
VAVEAGVPGKGWYWAAAVFAVASTAGAVALVAWAFLSSDANHPFLAPGRQALELDRTGDYTVWNDHRTVFDGRTYDAGEKLPAGVKIAVTEAASGQPLTVHPALGATFTSGNTERVSVASFTIARPGRYEIAVSGPIEQRVFSVGKDVVLVLFGAIFGAIALVILGYSAAIGIAIWAYLRRGLAGRAA